MDIKLTPKEAARIAARPERSMYMGDELVTLAEGLVIGQPHGPMTVRGLRTARDAGQLATVKIAGRLYTTLDALAAMSVLVLTSPQVLRAPKCRRTARAAKGGAMSIPRSSMSAVQAALADALATLPRQPRG